VPAAPRDRAAGADGLECADHYRSVGQHFESYTMGRGLFIAPGDVDGMTDEPSRLLQEAATRERFGFAARNP